jgi:hypothetical protein
MKEFRISIVDYDFVIKAEVFPSNKQMISAINDYIKIYDKNILLKSANAVWCGIPRFKIKDKLNKKIGIYERELGKIFLCKNHLNHCTISHECLHAAIDVCRTLLGFTWSIDNISDDQEEFFVGLYTDIYEEILRCLKSKNYKIKLI